MAAFYLRRFADPRSVEPLIAALRAADEDTQVRRLLERVFVDDPDADVRAEAAEALGALQNKRMTDLLAEALLHEHDKQVRAGAARGLG